MNTPAALAVGRRKDGVSPLIIDHRKIRMANATMLYSNLHFVVTKFPYLELKRDPCLRRDLPFPSLPSYLSLASMDGVWSEEYRSPLGRRRVSGSVWLEHTADLVRCCW